MNMVVRQVMNQMYIDEPFLGYSAQNLFCLKNCVYPRAKQISKWGNPHFEVHRGTSSSSEINFSYSLEILMNQMYIDVLVFVYGIFFAMSNWSGAVMYFSIGIELHRSTFGSSDPTPLPSASPQMRGMRPNFGGEGRRYRHA